MAPRFSALTRHEGRRRNQLLLRRCAAGLVALDRFHDRSAPITARYRRVALPPSLGGAEGWLLPPARDPWEGVIPPARRPDRQEGYRGARLAHVLDLRWRVVPTEERGVSLDVASLDPEVAEVLEARVPHLRLGLASPFQGLRYRFASRPGARTPKWGTPYRFTALCDEDREPARAALARILARCRDEGVDLLCLPELTLDAGLLTDLRALLAAHRLGKHPALVIAGSLHEGEPPDCMNRARVLDWAGRDLWCHEKCSRFSLTPRETAHLDPALRTAIGLDEDGGAEDIRLGQTLTLRDGPLGRMGLVICLDHLDTRLRALFELSGVDSLFVPAMSPATADFERTVEDLARDAHTASFVVNSAWLVAQLPPEQRDQVFLALARLPARVAAYRRTLGEELHVFTIRELLCADDR